MTEFAEERTRTSRLALRLHPLQSLGSQPRLTGRRVLVPERPSTRAGSSRAPAVSNGAPLC